ncbi:Enoyl-CoA hydratase/carnithine racemase [Corynebacterium coyleae]|uniref:Enoyl-CoA hydratase/isomerase family protein n=1 Tax=Corynebacterium coyleae TaxID=53374 RepID=A0ABX8KU06_9CORY|nr:3-hydroxyisobutyryl-CoA hydrolase [Corynebacterium coyleae]QXB18017.1 enoyl-CoA hydratase/isomerase family protein [Corynebacterium coyleae]WJY79474.1 Carnitinyl-CoA dehydratase [Corynebacterium coyleae]SEB80958.1 Enoyl-CoA hydratase/carnithine racemase [Corynebacterium coyleae]
MTEFVKTEVRGTTGVITLDRPKALNSLNPEMARAIDEILKQWRDDDTVTQVVIQSSGKHFCSGGDVRAARDGVLEGRLDEVDTFFADEYAMNLDIANYPKPYIALCNGVIMGGGMGVSAHGSHMVVTEDAFASMPEMNIGYITDVGMSWLLQNLPKRPSQALGAFLALTGYRLSPDDMLATGLATHKVASLDGVLDGIVEHGPGYLDEVALEQGESQLAALYSDIEATFTGSWAEIRERLDGEFGEKVQELTKQASPSSLVAAAELIAANASQDLAGALDNERRLGAVMVREPDFAEGVRAVLVDKDQAPKFAPEADPSKYRAVLR